MPTDLWDALVITAMTPAVYAIITYYPITMAFLFSAFIHKSNA